MEPDKLNDDELLEVLRDARAWGERDAQRTIKYQQLIKRAERKRRIRHLIVITSGIAAIFLAIIWMVRSGSQPRNDKNTLYAQFYEPFRFSIEYRDGNQDSLSAYQQAITGYRNQRWMVAEKLADSLMQIDPANPDFLLLSGLIEQAQGKFDEAINHYNSLVGSGGSYSLHASWYAALCHLKLGNINECKKQLDTLRQRSTFYRGKAEALGKLLTFPQR